MVKMATYCARCGEVHERGQRCPLRVKQSNQRHNSGYDAPEYRRNRQRALTRTAGKCARCGRTIADRHNGKWLMREGGVHHVRHLEDGGGHNARNLVPLCDECHLFMHR